jgi:hypothetical protein
MRLRTQIDMGALHVLVETELRLKHILTSPHLRSGGNRLLSYTKYSRLGYTCWCVLARSAKYRYVMMRKRLSTYRRDCTPSSLCTHHHQKTSLLYSLQHAQHDCIGQHLFINNPASQVSSFSQALTSASLPICSALYTTTLANTFNGIRM